MMEVSGVDIKEQDHVLFLYINTIKFVPIITIPIYCEAIYCVIKKSSNFQKHYTIILTSHIIGCLFEEFYGFQLFRPMVFLPVVGIYADGILSMLEVHPFIQLCGMFLCVQMNLAILTHISFYRLKIIIPISYRHYSRVINMGIFAIVFIYIGAALSVFTCFLLIENQTEAKMFLSSYLRPLPSKLWSEKYIVSTPRNAHLKLFLICGIICVGFYMALCLILPSLCFVILHRTKDSLSEKVVKAQKAYLRTILFQAMAIIICVIVPFCIFYVSTIPNLHLTNPMIIASSLIFSICHGAASTLIHLLSNKPFRDTVKTQLEWVKCCVTCSRPKRTNMIHTMSSIVG